MQAEAGQVELIRSRRLIKARQHAGNLVRMLRVQLAPVVVFIKPPQATMSKAPDHSLAIYSDNCHLSSTGCFMVILIETLAMPHKAQKPGAQTVRPVASTIIV